MSKMIRWIVIIVAILALWASLALGQEASAPTLDAAKKQAIVDEIAALLNKNYIFADKAKKVEEALRAKLAAGDLDKPVAAPDFARAVGAIILDVTKDRHTGLAYDPARAEDIRRLEGQSEEDARKVRERELEEARRENFGFRKVERLPGNIGYLDFRVFASPAEAGLTAIAAMNFLAYCDAIIVDLRQNGGDPAQIQLISPTFRGTCPPQRPLRLPRTDRELLTLPFVPPRRPRPTSMS
jgi:hypothetical protein